MIGGSLPPGLTLNSATGQITGTPTAPSSAVLTIRVQDAQSRTATSPLILLIYVRTDRVSVDNNTPPHPGNGPSTEPRTSGANGRYVVFVSQATNLLNPPPPGTPSVTGKQIYIRDRQTGQTSLVSKDNATTPNPGNGESSASTISADGRFVAFVSQATNLLDPLPPGTPAGTGTQIYIRDLTVNRTTLVSKDNNLTPNPGNGSSSAPTISADGRFVAFVSQATNLLDPPPFGTPAVTGRQVYIRDLTLNQTTLVSKDNNLTPIPGNGESAAPAISQDGRFVVFLSQATNLLNPPAPGTPAVSGQQIYVRDRTLNQTALVSKDNNVTPVPGNGTSSAPVIGQDGQFVAFVSQATNLLNPPAPGTPAATGQQIYLRDLTLNQTTLISKDNNTTPTPGNGVSSEPTISGDGRFVGFTSVATNLLNPPVPGIPAVTGQQIYLRDRTVNQTSLVSKDNNSPANPGNGPSSAPTIATDGSFIAFVSAATNLVSGGTVFSDIYTRALP